MQRPGGRRELASWESLIDLGRVRRLSAEVDYDWSPSFPSFLLGRVFLFHFCPASSRSPVD